MHPTDMYIYKRDVQTGVASEGSDASIYLRAKEGKADAKKLCLGILRYLTIEFASLVVH